ncbi:MAG: metal-dependent transcriptional regulator [Acidobacteriota bacterium]
MPTSTEEDYLKAIFQLATADAPADPSAEAIVSMGQIAQALTVAPGTVTGMVKALERRGLVRYQPYVGVTLTDEGRSLALHVLRRHRLIELFLVRVLGYDWSEVHDEAEQLEHALSDTLVERIDRLLGSPTVDPHGDPIPGPGGELAVVDLVSLAECAVGDAHHLRRVSDQAGAFLRFAETHGLVPGARLTVTAAEPAAHALTVQADGHDAVTLGREAAGKLWVERAVM